MSEPTCAFGFPASFHRTEDGCLWCQAETARGVEEFRAAVAAGKYDEQGYTPAERRAQAKRRLADVAQSER